MPDPIKIKSYKPADRFAGIFPPVPTPYRIPGQTGLPPVSKPVDYSPATRFKVPTPTGGTPYKSPGKPAGKQKPTRAFGPDWVYDERTRKKTLADMEERTRSKMPSEEQIANLATYGSNFINSFRKAPRVPPPDAVAGPSFKKMRFNDQPFQVANATVRKQVADQGGGTGSVAAQASANYAATLNAMGQAKNQFELGQQELGMAAEQMRVRTDMVNSEMKSRWNDDMAGAQMVTDNARSANVANAADKYIAGHNLDIAQANEMDKLKMMMLNYGKYKNDAEVYKQFIEAGGMGNKQVAPVEKAMGGFLPRKSFRKFGSGGNLGDTTRVNQIVMPQALVQYRQRGFVPDPNNPGVLRKIVTNQTESAATPPAAVKPKPVMAKPRPVAPARTATAPRTTQTYKRPPANMPGQRTVIDSTVQAPAPVQNMPAGNPWGTLTPVDNPVVNEGYQKSTAAGLKYYVKGRDLSRADTIYTPTSYNPQQIADLATDVRLTRRGRGAPNPVVMSATTPSRRLYGMGGSLTTKKFRKHAS